MELQLGSVVGQQFGKPAAPNWRNAIRSALPAVVLLVTAAVIVLSILSRSHFIDTRPLAGRLDGQEPESHILITDIAYTQTMASVHKFLPIFNLGAPYNKFIDEHPGAESPDAEGNFFYTSTPPLTFILPYLATLGQPTLQALRWYNVGLQCLAASSLALLVLLCLRRSKASPGIRVIIGCSTALIYMTAPECLRSHTINLWAQQFYAVLLPIQIIFFLFLPSRAALFILAFVGCLSDWTAYVASLAMIGVASWRYWQGRDQRWLRSGLAIAFGSAAGGLTMIAWFAQVMPIMTYFHDLAQRSADRADGNAVTLLLFIPRYIESYGLFLPVAIIAITWRRFAHAGSDATVTRDPGADALKIAILVFGCALTENLLMKHHALLYSYDRLKGVQLLALVVGWASLLERRDALFTFSLCVTSGVASLALFHMSYETTGGSNFLRQSQQQLIGEIIGRTASPLGPAFFNGEVRGSEVYYAGRNIVQTVDMAAVADGVDEPSYVRAWARRHGFDRGTLYDISGHYPWPEPSELPRTLRITQVFVDGRPTASRTVILRETPGDYHAAATPGKSLLPARPW